MSQVIMITTLQPKWEMNNMIIVLWKLSILAAASFSVGGYYGLQQFYQFQQRTQMLKHI
jgi:hypothetical protein